MKITVEFVGHACFRIWQDERPLVVTDPFTPSDVDLPDDVTTLEADNVIVSSLTDLSHNNYGMVTNNPTVINALDVAQGKAEATLNDEPVICIQAAEHPNHPTGADDNATYAFKVGDLWFAHLGDLGFGLTEKELLPWVGRSDVLLALTGDKYSLSLDELDEIIELLKPKLIFPMHYHLPPPGGPMKPVSAFLERRPADPVVYVPHHSIDLPLPDFKPGHPTIVVLQPSGYTPEKDVLHFC